LIREPPPSVTGWLIFLTFKKVVRFEFQSEFRFGLFAQTAVFFITVINASSILFAWIFDIR